MTEPGSPAPNTRTRPPGEPADASFPEDLGGQRWVARRSGRRGPAAVRVDARPA